MQVLLLRNQAFCKYYKVDVLGWLQITFCVTASFSFIPMSQATSLFWELFASDIERNGLIMNLNAHPHSAKFLVTLDS